MTLRWNFKKFDELSTLELYNILTLRNMVFVVEQHCPYLDTDGIDEASSHLCGWEGNVLVVYARIIPPGIVYPEASIGRVVSNPVYRKTGAGKLLMQKAIQELYDHFNVQEIKIGAQLYLEQFYSGFGFKKISVVYLEDGIPHIKMLHTK
ncbi:MAG TPA: GNAT family N-acetyltransferase [Ferruginibacter sp.]|nr:GNAT family N-acetyltransferase [Ferruginibacter sp.]